MKNLILIILSVILVAMGLQILTTEKQTAKFTKGLISSQFDPEMMLVKNQKYDLSFQIKNLGNEKLIIEDIQSDCSCTLINNYKDREINLSDSSKFLFTFSASFQGYFERRILVYYNDENSPLIYKFKGFVNDN